MAISVWVYKGWLCTGELADGRMIDATVTCNNGITRAYSKTFASQKDFEKYVDDFWK